MAGQNELAGIRRRMATVVSGFVLSCGISTLQAQSSPSYSERMLAARADFREAMRLAPDPQSGARLFGTCAACHGADGRGTDDGTVPAIAGQHVPVLVKQLVDFRHDRRWDERMQNFSARHHLSGPQELHDVAAYAQSLPRGAARGDRIGSGEGLQQGASVYFRECENCHGPLGQGDSRRLRPRLAGQHYEYLLRQLDDIANLRREMDDLHLRRIRALSLEERRGVADYLSRLSPELTSEVTEPGADR